MPLCALLGRIFNNGKPFLTFRCVGYVIASRIKDEPLLPLGMKEDRLG